jgi:hypothetical protein
MYMRFTDLSTMVYYDLSRVAVWAPSPSVGHGLSRNIRFPNRFRSSRWTTVQYVTRLMDRPLVRTDFAETAETAITSASDDTLAAVRAIDNIKSAADSPAHLGERLI